MVMIYFLIFHFTKKKLNVNYMLTLYIKMILYGIVDFSMNAHVQSNCKVAT